MSKVNYFRWRLRAVCALTAVLGLGAPAIFAQAQPQSCSQPTPLRIQVFEGSIINMQAIVAMKQGFLQKHCLAGSLVPIVNTPLSVTATMNGTVDLINSGTDNIVAARAQGIKLKMVSNIADRAIYSLVVRKELVKPSYRETLQALSGKKVGVVVVGGSNEFHARLHFTDEGMPANSVTYVSLGLTNSMLMALEKGTVDAVVFFGTAQDMAVAKGMGVIVSDSRKPVGPNNPVPKSFQVLGPTSLLWAAQESFIQKNPEAILRFKVAMTEASAWTRDPANRSKLYELMKDQLAIPGDVPGAEKIYRDSIDTYAAMTSSTLSRDAVKAYIDFTVAARDVKTTLTVDELVWDGRK
ncbi:MAG: ABC transporter substrate-binding protein [Burkholderiaceae bacterium]|nr:ABC transporter substrate-binding protein [Burkholderiaceae bacterium]